MTKKSIYLAWRSNDPNFGWSPVGRLDRSEEGFYEFCYTKGAERSDFSPLPGMEDLSAVYQSNELFPVFYNRLLNSRRDEYKHYLEWSDLDVESQPDPLSILEVTEGRKSTDYFEVFPCPVADSEGLYQFKFFLHGIEWLSETSINRVSKLKKDESLLCMSDFQNEYDPNAVALRTTDDRYIVGYLPRYICHDFMKLAQECDPDFMNLTIVRVNSDAPLQFRVLCQLKACWPDNYQPCDHEVFRPIPSELGRAKVG